MKTTVERESPTKVKLLVEVEPHEVDRLTSDTVRKLSQDMKIPGFRKGKVPRQIIESRVGKDAIRQRMLEESLPQLYGDATRNESLRPVASPDLEVTDFEGDTLTFTATVEVRPDLVLPNYLDLEVERPSSKASQEEIDDRLEVLRGQHSTLEPVARSVGPKDHVLLDVRATHHDEVIDEATANDLLYEVGSGKIVPEIDAEIIGKRAGDIVKFNSHLPAHLPPPRGGMEVTLTVIIKEVNAKRLPPVDDDFAKAASEFDTLDELENEIRARIEEYKGVQADREVSNRVLDELIEITDVPVPESLIDAEAEHRMKTLTDEVTHHGMTLEGYLEVVKMSREELAETQRRGAERSIAADFILDEIAKKEDLSVTRAEFDDEVKRLATRAGKTVEELKRDIVEAGRVEALAGDILRRKVLVYLVEHAKIVDENTENTEEAG